MVSGGCCAPLVDTYDYCSITRGGRDYYGDDCADYHADCEAFQDCDCTVGLFGIFVKCGDPLCAAATSGTLP